MEIFKNPLTVSMENFILVCMYVCMYVRATRQKGRREELFKFFSSLTSERRLNTRDDFKKYHSSIKINE